MQKRLFFICPTDNLEPVLNNKFEEENYYCTSLGNSVKFDKQTVREINDLIIRKRINEITFVLSDDNQIVSEVLKSGHPHFLEGLEDFKEVIQQQESNSKKLWKEGDFLSPVLSNYLKYKIKELLPNINKWIIDQVRINAKIYYKQEDVLSDVNSDLFHMKYFNLN